MEYLWVEGDVDASETDDLVSELEELVSMFSTSVLSPLGVESSEKGPGSPWKGRTYLMRFLSQHLTQVHQVLVVAC